VTRLFKKIHQQVDMLPPLTFHGLRHCFASLALAGGADIAVVSKLLGHASISITSDVYGAPGWHGCFSCAPSWHGRRATLPSLPQFLHGLLGIHTAYRVSVTRTW
jgi:hypothetical protein